jgi:hypothetical protein
VEGDTGDAEVAVGVGLGFEPGAGEGIVEQYGCSGDAEAVGVSDAAGEGGAGLRQRGGRE